MVSIRPFVEERIEQIENMTVISVECGFVRFVFFKRLDPFRVICFLSYFLENLDLIVWGFKVMWWTFHDFNRNVISVLEVFCEPDSREMSPTEFLDKNVSVNKNFTDMARMIAANLIILNTFIFAMIFFIEVEDKFFEGTKNKKGQYLYYSSPFFFSDFLSSAAIYWASISESESRSPSSWSSFWN